MESEKKNKTEIKLSEKFEISDEFPIPVFEEWKAKVIEDLKGADYNRKLTTKTYEGIDLKPIYTKSDLENITDSDFPGFQNFKRGIKSSGYKSKSWEITQEYNYADALKLNEALKNDTQKGLKGIRIALDDATKLGVDADYADPLLVGNKGLSVSACRSLKRVFDGIDLNKFPVWIDAGFSTIPFLMVFDAFLREIYLDRKNFRGGITADPITYLAENGNLPLQLSKVYDQLTDTLNFVEKFYLDFKSISINSFVYVDAGASAIQELGFAAATGLDYLSQLTDRNLSAEKINNSIVFNFGIGSFFFMEIAKFRAVKIIWSKILNAFGVKESELNVTLHARTTKFNQTKLDPYVNMLRTTTEAFSAVIGGVDALQTNPFDESFNEPNQFSRRIARNTQIILGEESHLDNLIDAAGGSFYIENLTAQIAEKAWEIVKQIEAEGGMYQALKKGIPQQMVADTLTAKINDLSKRKTVLVGTNMYANTKEKQFELRRTDNKEFIKKRSEFLQKYRIEGDDDKHKKIIEHLEKAAHADPANSIEIASEAIRLGATVGELTNIFRQNVESEKLNNKLNFPRLSENFEQLREESIRIAQMRGYPPTVFLANMGSLKQHKARADFSRGFFETGGFEVIYPAGFDNEIDAANTAAESKTDVIVICSTDDTYPEIVPKFINKLNERNCKAKIVLAGYPKDQVEAHKKSGVDEFIYVGANALEILKSLIAGIGGNQ